MANCGQRTGEGRLVRSAHFAKHFSHSTAACPSPEHSIPDLPLLTSNRATSRSIQASWTPSSAILRCRIPESTLCLRCGFGFAAHGS